MINPQHLKKVKIILDYLNGEYPPPKVLSQKVVDGELITFKAQMDPYFVAYLEHNGNWGLCCSDFWVWQNCSHVMEELCKTVKKEFKIWPCFISYLSVNQLKQKAANKEYRLFIGRVSWAK